MQENIFEEEVVTTNVSGGWESKVPAIILTGPLAPAMRKVLDKMYAKKVDEKTGIVLEESDAVTLDDYDPSLVYCTNASDLNMTDLMGLTHRLTMLGGRALTHASVILEGFANLRNPVEVVFRNTCKRHHVPIYSSASEYLRKNQNV